MYLLYCAAFTFLTVVKAERWCCDPPTDVAGQIAKLVELYDHNNDSIIELAELQYDFDMHMDHNHDNKTSRVEYVLARHCLVGEDYIQAETTFNRLDRNKHGYLTIEDFTASSTGKPPVKVAVMVAGLKAAFAAYEKDKASGVIIGR